MSVKSTTFGGVRLSGEDAKKFIHQVTHGRPKQAARDAYDRGKPLVSEYNGKGYATIRAKNT